MRWMTDPVTWDELPQVTDDYVVHARGFVVDSDIWLDPFAVRSGHKKLWREVVSDEYDIDWNGHRDTTPESVLYWSITGSSVLIVQGSSDIEEYVELFDELDMPDDAQIHGDVMMTVGDVQ